MRRSALALALVLASLVAGPADAQTAIAALPVLKLGGPTQANPTLEKLPVPRALSPAASRIGCAYGPVAPVARLQVSRKGHWVFMSQDARGMHVTNAQGGCFQSNDQTHAKALDPGSYVLWVQLDRKDRSRDHAPYAFRVRDDDRPVVFSGGAPVVDLGALATPVAVHSKIKPKANLWRTGFCGGVSRTPAFYLHATQDVGWVVVSALRQPHAKPAMFVYGPMDQVTAHGVYDCDDTDHAARFYARAGQTWAVFLYGVYHDPAVGAPVDTLVMRSGARPGLMATPIPIPDPLPLPQREVSRQYPFYGAHDLQAFFLGAPDRLFVYLTLPDAGVPANEPLALLAYGQNLSKVARADGGVYRVATNRLTGTRPAKVVLPGRLPKVKHARSFDEAMTLATPADTAAIKAYDKVDKKYQGCFEDYMSKHDPTYDKDYELVNLRTGKTVTDVWARRADRHCGGRRWRHQAKRIIRHVNRSLQVQARAYRKGLEQRFGH